MINTTIPREAIYIEAKDGKTAYRVNFQDLYDSANLNLQLSSTYEISMTLTYTEASKDVYNVAKAKRGIYYFGQWYDIQQLEPALDANGVPTLKLTATATLIDRLKNLRKDPDQPTEDHPQTSGSSDTDTTTDNDDNVAQAGTVVKKVSEEQNLHPLSYYLDNFFNGNRFGVKYELHGDFPQASVDETGDCYSWLTSNLSTFKAYWVPNNYTLKIYDLAHLRFNNGRQFRYLHNLAGVDIQTNASNLVNICRAYGGRMEKTTTTITGGGGAVGNLQMVNGDYVAVLKSVAALVGEHLSDADINLVKAQVILESGGDEKAHGGDDGLADGIAKGILQFKQGTFDYYSRPPFTDIWTAAGQFVALLNIPNWRNQITGHSGWSPHGAPISKETITVKPAVDDSWGWPFPSVGEGSFLTAQKFGFTGGGRTNGFHDGLDFGSIDHPGSEVHAIHGGKVTISRAWGSGGIGWYVVIQDSSGLNVEYQEAFASPGNITVNVGDVVKTGDVIGYRNTDHLHVGVTRAALPGAFSHAFVNDGTWLDPQAMIKNGGDGSSGGSTGGSTTTSTSTDSYYSVAFLYKDQESIDQYGEHWGPDVIMDSIYDEQTLREYIDATVQHQPATTISISDAYERATQLGEVWRFVVPELNLDVDVTLVGIDGVDQRIHPGGSTTYTFDNTGLAMKDVNVAIRQDIRRIRTSQATLNVIGGVGEHQETHEVTNKYTESQMDTWRKFLDGEEVTWND